MTHPAEHADRYFMFVEFPPAGGLFQFAAQLGEGLARRGHLVDIVTGPQPELSSREQNCRIRSIFPTWHPAARGGLSPGWHRARRIIRGVRHVLAWLILLTTLRRERPDVVLWSDWRFPLDGWGVQMARRVLPTATLGIIAHEPRPLTEQSGREGLYKDRTILRRALANAYGVIDVAYVLGETTQTTLRHTWPQAPSAHVIPHGDESVFRLTVPKRASATKAMVLFFGTITAYKGLDILLAAWPQIRQEVPEATLCVAGALSADVDGGQVRHGVNDLEGIDLRLGYVPLDEVPALFSNARVVVLPYRRSSQSGVAHLAHTFARPVVATRVGDIPAVVQHRRTGLLVEPEDREGLVAAVLTLLRDPAAAERLGEAGYGALVANASWDSVALAVETGLP